MKKIILCAISALSLIGLSACGGASKQDSLTLWIPQYQYGDGPSDEEFWTGKLAAFEEEHGVSIDLEILPWTRYTTTVYTGLLSGDGPDVVYVTDVYDLIAADLIAPLDEYLSDADKENYIYLNQGARDTEGRLRAMPMMVGNACVIYFNADMLAEAGITDMPATWDDFIALCHRIQDSSSGNTLPFMQPWGASSGASALLTSFWPYYFQAGGQVLNENGELDLNNQAGIDALNFIKRLKDEGIFGADINSLDDPVGKFINNEAAVVVLGTGQADTFTKRGINWETLFSTAGPAGEATLISVDSLAVAQNSEKKDVAAELVKYITSAAVMDDFHTQIYAMPSITHDAQYKQAEPFQTMYDTYSDRMFSLPPFEGAASLQDLLMQNVHRMLNGELTAEAVLSETMAYYNEQLKS